MILDFGFWIFDFEDGDRAGICFSGRLTRLSASNGEIRGGQLSILVQGRRKFDRGKFLKSATKTP
jgi:hypothetical protein